MKIIDNSIVSEYLDNNYKKELVNRAKYIFNFKVESPEVLYSFIMQYHRTTEFLTPAKWSGLIKRSMTIGNIIDRLIQRDISFEYLASGKVVLKKLEWYKRFEPMINNFDYNKMDPLLVTMPNNQERKENNISSFRLVDGQHRTLYLAYLLKTDAIEFQPIEVNLLTPRIWKG